MSSLAICHYMRCVVSFTLHLCFSVCLAVCLVSVNISHAQTINLGGDLSRPVPGVGHDYIHMLNETVDPASGNLSLKIDLPVPKGRGLTLPFSITYNSGEVFLFGSPWTGCGGLGTTGTNGCSEPMPLGRVVNGWSDTFPYATNNQILATQPGYSTPNCPATSSYVFFDPSGASHMLGLSVVSPSVQCESATYNDTSCNADPQTGGTYCTDGFPLDSRTEGGDDQVFAQAPSNCYAGGNEGGCQSGNWSPFTVTDLNGTTYYFPSASLYPSYIEDRNGNKLQVPTTGPLSLTDTLGRQVVTISGTSTSPGPTAYQVGGLSYIPTWGTTTANFPTTGSELPWTNSVYQEIGVGCKAYFTVASSAINVITAISLPNSQQYRISYDPTWGLPQEIDYPDGGWVRYTWKVSDTPNTLATFDGNAGGDYPPIWGACNYIYSAPVVATRTMGYTPGVTAQYQQFTYYTCWNSSSAAPTCPSNPDGHNPANQNTTPAATYPTDPRVWQWKATQVVSTSYLPNNTTETSTTYYTYGSVFQSYQPNSGGQLRAQLPVESTIDYQDWNGTLIKTVNKVWADQLTMASETDTYPNAGSAKTNYTYVSISEVLSYLQEKDEYDFGQTSPFKTTKYSYYSFTGPSLLTETPGVTVGVPSQVIVSSGGTTFAETDATYDGSTPSGVSNLPQGTHDAAYEGTSPFLSRGNPTKVVRCTSGTGSSCAGPTTTYTYDEAGQVLSRTDPCGNATCSDMSGTNHKTSYSYADSYTILSGGKNVAYPSGTNTDALLTQITDPLGFTQNFTYDFNSSYLTSATDENGQPTYYVYNDSLNRPTSTTYPDGGQTEIAYDDAAPNPTVTTCTLMSGTQGAACSPTSPPPGWKTSAAVRDGLDHVIETEIISDPSGTDNVTMSYDGEGHLYSQSNPFRGSAPPANTTTTYYYDALGRTIEQQNADGSLLQTCYNHTPSSPAVANCSALLNQNTTAGSITGTWEDSTDENGNHWQRASDAFGRLTQVAEPNGASQSPTMVTSYSYDPLNNLLGVKQWGGPVNSSGSRVRNFYYNSLSQLTSGSNPETGAVGYTYDLNGNVFTKTDMRNVMTTYSYDSLNHLLGKSYSNDPINTPSSCYLYGTSTSGNTVERLIDEWTQNPSVVGCSPSFPPSGGYLTASANFAYDAMGRLRSEQQYTPASVAKGTSYPMAYTYDLAGNLTSSTTGAAPPSMTFQAPAAPCAGAPSFSTVTFMFVNCYDGAGRMASVTSNAGSGPTSLFTTQGYAPFGALTNATYGSSGSSSNAVTLTRTYDPRTMRITSETDLGNSPSSNTNGSATVTITGAEQSQ